jgi:hypothetical protein
MRGGSEEEGWRVVGGRSEEEGWGRGVRRRGCGGVVGGRKSEEW